MTLRITAAKKRWGWKNAARVLKLYPFEMSGGMLQRMMICDGGAVRITVYHRR